MITEYKVLQPFSFLQEGDVLKYNNGMYEYEDSTSTDNFHSYVHVALNKDFIEDCANSGLVEACTTEDKTIEECNCNQCDKLKKISTLISQLKNTYNQRKNNIEKKYNDGKIQTCVKVEHDTVYFNMMKLLDKIESIVNE